MFVHNSVKLTSLNIDSYCLDQYFEMCAIHLNSVYVKVWILATYRSPLGSFNNFLTNFYLLYTNFLILILILLSVEALMLITLRRVITKSTRQYFTVI